MNNSNHPFLSEEFFFLSDISYENWTHMHRFTLFSKYNPITNDISIDFFKKDLTLFSIPTIQSNSINFEGLLGLSYEP